ncbi:conserved hypothetical protein [uncultured Pleomorphomonas sp.]|uniref:DUF1778 domain-containing protein n=1 Tax=uncultured Pleomorphomonas sp. TaxID=442121 RepID=A0A212LKH2_9HYPH|nr:DUF1778 domain-containing protein [uncultured Pleomorphomonas sp.]SCM78042.1 conserved hypothetical protein [uncultured Pleomorphomonas sp.]
MRARSPRTEKLDLRISPRHKDVLRAAAEAARKSVSDFVLDSALSRADEILADQRVIALSPEEWAAFQQALDAPPEATPRLARLASEQGLLD